MKKTLLLIFKNLIRAVILLLCVSIAAFALVSLSPVDPLQANVGQAALGSMSKEQIQKLETYWGVDQPPIERYLAWLGDFVKGDMGTSLLYRRDVSEVLWERLKSSLLLMLFAWIMAGIAGFALGIFAGINRGRPADKIIRGYALVTASTPTFWLALVFLLVFSVWLGILPIGLSKPIGAEAPSFLDSIRHAVLPAAVLSITGISGITLHTREKTIDVMESDYVMFALARGEKMSSIVLRHGLRNIMLPAITLQFASISEIIGGSILVEQVFSYPGLGQAAVSAGLGGDIPLLMAITIISAAIVFAGNFTANTLYGIIDPKIRRGYKN